MGTTWYYVHQGQKVGPIDEQSFFNLIHSKTLTEDSYVWRKGLSNWQQIFSLPELMDVLKKNLEISSDQKALLTIEAQWFQVDREIRSFFIKQHPHSTIFGPYSLNMITEIRKQKRLNDYSWIFAPHMPLWVIVGAIPLYQELFGEHPPDEETLPLQKGATFNTLLANFTDLSGIPHQGVVQDISLGGLQVITSPIPLERFHEIPLTLKPLFKLPPLTINTELIRHLDENGGFFARFKNPDETALTGIRRYMDLLN